MDLIRLWDWWMNEHVLLWGPREASVMVLPPPSQNRHVTQASQSEDPNISDIVIGLSPVISETFLPARKTTCFD